MPKSDFKVERFLGKGSYGSVSLTTRIKDNKQYALKEINVAHMQLRDRMDQLNEIRILASIYHPNVLGYYEAFIENGKLYIVTDYCGQGDLEKLIQTAQKSKTRIPESTIWDVVLQTLNGLKAIHAHNILHRDIKSQNILIHDNVYKIADFGVSKVARPGELARTAIGTPYYISPEIWRQERYGAKTDVYSLGCLYYELCTLQHPFGGRDVRELQRNVLRGVYKRIPEYYSAELRGLIAQMLQSSPRARPSVDALVQMECVRRRKDLCPTLFDEEVLAGSQTQARCGMGSVVSEPQMLQTIRMNANLARIMNGHIGGGNPRSKYYQAVEAENQRKLARILPQQQYKRR